jgi:hypothetical protein
MKPRTSRVVPLRVALGVVVAVLLAVPLTLSARADGPANSDGGFVLLSMEQAAMYRGTQMIVGCNGTGTYGHCSGSTGNSCNDYSYENCPSSVTNFGNHTIHYCDSYGTGTMGVCHNLGYALCYTTVYCIRDDERAICKNWFTWNTTAYDDVCLNPVPLPKPN